MLFSVFSAGCLYVLMTFAVNIANDISEKILNGEIGLDVSSLIAEISSQLNGTAGEPPNVATLLLLGCWGIAIIDSFVLGRKLTEPTKSN